MKRTSNPSMKRKRPDDEAQAISPKSAKKSSPSDIRPIVVTSHKIIPFGTSIILSQISLECMNSINIQAKRNAQRDVLQESLEKLKAEIAERESEMMDSEDTMNFIDQIEVNANKKKRLLDRLKDNLVNYYAPMVTLMAQKLTNIDEVRDKIKSIGLDNQTSFRREIKLRKNKLGKVNNDIDFELRQRLEAELQKSIEIEKKHKEALKVSQLRKELEDENDQAKCEEEANVRKLDKLKNRIEQIKDNASENAENYLLIKEEHTTLTAEQENANLAFVDLVQKNFHLNCELNQLEAKTNEFKNQFDGIRRANRNLWNKEDQEQSKLEFDEKYSARLIDEKNMIAKLDELQIAVDRRYSQYNELKEIQSEIAEKEQHHAEVESKLNVLTIKILKRLNKIGNTQKSINEMEVRLFERAKQALNFVKLSPKTMHSDDDNMSMLSKFSNEALQLESEAVWDTSSESS